MRNSRVWRVLPQSTSPDCAQLWERFCPSAAPRTDRHCAVGWNTSTFKLTNGLTRRYRLASKRFCRPFIEQVSRRKMYTIGDQRSRFPSCWGRFRLRQLLPLVVIQVYPQRANGRTFTLPWTGSVQSLARPHGRREHGRHIEAGAFAAGTRRHARAMRQGYRALDAALW